MSDIITYEDFERAEIRVGTIVDAKPFPEARKPALQLWVDFGEALGVKKSSAQLTAHYLPDKLIGRQVMAVTNFPPRQIGSFMSEVLVLGVPDENGGVVLLSPGTSSYDLYKNYKERGDHFCSLVKAMTASDKDAARSEPQGAGA